MDVQKPFVGPVGGGRPAGFPPVGETGGNCTWLGGWRSEYLGDSADPLCFGVTL